MKKRLLHGAFAFVVAVSMLTVPQAAIFASTNLQDGVQTKAADNSTLPDGNQAGRNSTVAGQSGTESGQSGNESGQNGDQVGEFALKSDKNSEDVGNDSSSNQNSSNQSSSNQGSSGNGSSGNQPDQQTQNQQTQNQQDQGQQDQAQQTKPAKQTKGTKDGVAGITRKVTSGQSGESGESGQSGQSGDQADSKPNTVEELRYASLADALSEVKDGEVITLYGDIKEVNTISDLKVTINLNGHTIKAKGGSSRFAFKVDSGAELTLKNGTITGGNTMYKHNGVLHNEGTLNIENMTFTGNSGSLIKNNDGVLTIADSTFTENNEPATTGGQTYLVYNDGYTAKAVIKNSKFKNNIRPYGGIIYSSGSYYASRSKNELTLTGCDIEGNTVGWYGSLGVTYNTKLTLNDTTIKGNRGGVTGSYTGGLYFSSGQVHWNDSAIYGNDMGEGTEYGADLYISDSTSMTAGEIPLAEDMVDHGKKLTGYQLYCIRYNEVATSPIDKSKRTRSEWVVEPAEPEGGIAETGGKIYPTIAKAVDAAVGDNPTVKIIADAKVSENVKGKKGLVIDLDGHVLTGVKNGSNILNIEGDATIRNGSVDNCKSTNNQKPAFFLSKGTFTLEDLSFTGNLGSAVRIYTADGSKVSNCTFTGNGKSNQGYCYGLELIDSPGAIKNCDFDDNSQGLRVNVSSEPKEVTVQNCNIKNSLAKALELRFMEGAEIKFTGCTISGTHENSDEDETISIESVGWGDEVGGGHYIFEECKITGNKSKKNTIDLKAGKLTLDGSLIQGNEAENAGGVNVDIFSELELRDTIIKNNKATGTKRDTCGGVVLDSATYIYNEYDYDLQKYISHDMGLYAASLKMTGGAVYDNHASAGSPSAEDIYVDRSCTFDVPKVSEFKDGDKDFSGMAWMDDNKTGAEEQPVVKTGVVRYYSAGKKPALRQVYLDPKSGSEDGLGTVDSPVKTIEQARKLAEENGCTTIMVNNTITIDTSSATSDMNSDNSDGLARYLAQKIAKSFVANAADENVNETAEKTGVLDLGGMTLKRSPGFTGYMIDVKAGSELKITDTILDGNGRSGNKALSSIIKLNRGAKLTLGNGARLQYNGVYGNKTLPNDGGGIYSDKGEINILDGSQIIGNYAVKGGGIIANGGTINMSGGLIDDNTALWDNDSNGKVRYRNSYGGGIALRFGAKMNLSGGTISNNEALQDGGGISMGDFYTDSVTQGGTIELNMTGGKIDGNTAYSSGGGILVQCCTVARITGGEITNNEAKNSHSDSNFAGGGIYVNGYHSTASSAFGIVNGKLYLESVEITGNSANWEGGAIAWCGAGTGGFSELKGTVIYDNESKGNAPSGWRNPYYGDYEIIYDNIQWIYDYDADDWAGVYALSELINATYTSEYMLNGAPYNWYDENGDPVDTATLHKNKTVFKLNSDVKGTDPDVIASSAMAKVRINGNKSGSNGGGIGANGNVFMGVVPEHVDIPVEKKWDDEGREDERFARVKFDLYRDGKYVNSIIVSEADGWKGKFVEQPEYRVDANGELTNQPYEYTVREDMKYKPRGGMAVEECYKSKAKLVKGTWVVTNTPKDYFLPVTPPLKAIKTLDGKAPEGRQFTFELYDSKGQLIDSQKNNGEAIEFAPMEFDEPGNYEYIIKEKVNDSSGTGNDEAGDNIKYDTTEYKAVIEVVRDGNQLKSHVTYYRMVAGAGAGAGASAGADADAGAGAGADAGAGTSAGASAGAGTAGNDEELANGELPTFRNETIPEEPPEEPENPPEKPDNPPEPSEPEIPTEPEQPTELEDTPEKAFNPPPSETKVPDKSKVKTLPDQPKVTKHTPRSAGTGDEVPVKTIGLVAIIAGLIALLAAIIGIIARKGHN